MIVVVSYDVTDDARRRRLRTLLEGYGVAVQRSVFECDLAPAQAERLLKRAGSILAPDDDDLRLYSLCARCRIASIHVGPGPTGEQPQRMLF